jgi:choline-sulfatase
MNAKAPNIVLILADQMAAAALPCHRHPVVQAPNVTRLVQEGAVFDSAYCSSPLCAPPQSPRHRRPMDVREGRHP